MTASEFPLGRLEFFEQYPRNLWLLCQEYQLNHSWMLFWCFLAKKSVQMTPMFRDIYQFVAAPPSVFLTNFWIFSTVYLNFWDSSQDFSASLFDFKASLRYYCRLFFTRNHQWPVHHCFFWLNLPRMVWIFIMENRFKWTKSDVAVNLKPDTDAVTQRSKYRSFCLR